MTETLAPESAPDLAVTIRNLRFCWPGAACPVVAIDDLSIARGERVFVCGPSGAGKTTLLSLLAGIVVAQQGELRMLGHDLAALSGTARDRWRADHLGYVFQMFNLLPYLSLVDNVILPCRFSARRRHRALARANGHNLRAVARGLLERLDLAAEARAQRPVTALSVGQQQRVAVARALIGAPEILLADEPTSALDATRRQGFLDLLERECRAEGTTLIVVSHDPLLAAGFERMVDLAAPATTAGAAA